jgi:signal transduction histidine kinase
VPILNPILAKFSVQGIIITWSHLPEAFTDRDTWLLSEIGSQAALAIRNARLLEDSQRRAMELAVFDDVARTLTGTLDLDEVLALIMEQVERMLEVEAGVLFLIDPLTDELVFKTALGDKVKTMKPFRLAKGQGIAGRVASIGRPVCLSNLTPQIRNVLGVPLVLHGQIIGIIEVRNKQDGDFTRHDLSLLTSFAAYAAIGIGNARLYENVLAERDRVLEAEERARHDLARDLHDGPTQIVSGLVMGLEFCQNLLHKEPTLLAQELHNLHDEAERATYQMRTLLFGLRPLILESEGLAAAVRVFLERRQKGIKTPKLILKVEGSWLNSNGISRQDGQVEAAVFAVVQEAVNNAIKHAQAQEIAVMLRETYRGLYATITDDGQGFDVEQKLSDRKRRVNLGMVNIQERTELIGGELKITSVPGRGSELNIYVPKASEERHKKRTTTGPLKLTSR